MFDRLGPLGIAGLLFILVGLTLVTWASPIVGAGLALVFVGTGLVIKGVVGSILQTWGMV
ncbi:MAG: hypothetical protein ACI91T_001133 [Natronomonas sp.]|jgi:hypothetical protein